YQVEPGAKAATDLLTRHPELTAIVAANDLLGLGCYRAVRSLGKEVPADISVTGYNDVPLLDLMQPPMTAVRIPFREMGKRAATVLLAGLAGQPVATEPKLLEPELIVRASTVAPDC